MSAVEAGQTWRDKRTGRPPFDDIRRIAVVASVDDRYVRVVGRYQNRTEEGWKDAGWPNSARHSRVLIEGFVRTHELLEAEQ